MYHCSGLLPVRKSREAGMGDSDLSYNRGHLLSLLCHEVKLTAAVGRLDSG